MGAYRTEQRSSLMAYLQQHQDVALTAEQIAQGVGGMSLSTVYRNLNALVEQGKVHRTVGDDGRTALYRYHDREHCASHLHLRCVSCGKLEHMDANVSQGLLDAVRARSDFEVDALSTEILGRCKRCR